MRSSLKRGVELALCRSGLPAWLRRRRGHDTIILAWHNVVPDGQPAGGDRSLHIPQSLFARQLDVLLRTHDVVPLGSVLDGAQKAERARPGAVVTFDDAYQGALTAGVAELRSRGLPATVFVSPWFVGGRSFWWDALTETGEASLADTVRQHALHELGGRDTDVRAWAEDRGVPLQAVPAYMRCATEAQLTAAEDVVAYGSHGWSHAWLPALAGAELRRELELPRQWLQDRFSRVVDCIAYPYGGCVPAVARAAQEAGYTAGLLVQGGWLGAGSPDGAGRMTLPRYNVPAGLSAAGFELRVSGLLMR